MITKNRIGKKNRASSLLSGCQLQMPESVLGTKMKAIQEANPTMELSESATTLTIEIKLFVGRRVVMVRLSAGASCCGFRHSDW
jgi:hypothetical protein